MSQWTPDDTARLTLKLVAAINRIAELEAAEGRIRALAKEPISRANSAAAEFDDFRFQHGRLSLAYGILRALDGPPDDQQDRVLTAADVALARAATSVAPSREDFSEFLDDTDDQQDRKVPT